jgi:hypothetical protein
MPHRDEAERIIDQMADIMTTEEIDLIEFVLQEKNKKYLTALLEKVEKFQLNPAPIPTTR